MGEHLIGKILDGRYKILQVLGVGGMGTVYKATELSLERDVAIKLIRPNCLDEDGFARFEREAAILALLLHKHIMMFLRLGVAPDGTNYIVSEFIEGMTLTEVLRNQTAIDWRRAAAIGVQVSDALAYAHQKGIVHRDLKPDNIMLAGEDFVKVLDFGLGTIVDTVEAARDPDYQKLTKTGQIIGTVNYLSPEQCAGKKSDQRSDIYALGCILYEAIVGEAPFAADNAVAVMYKHTLEDPRPLSEFPSSAGVPKAFEMLLLKALAKDPSLRFQSMAELQDALQNLLDPSATQAAAGLSNSIGKHAKALILVLILACACACLSFNLIAKNKEPLTTTKDPLDGFGSLSGHAQFQAIMNHQASSTANEMIKIALASKKLATNERIELEFAQIAFCRGSEKIRRLVELLDRISTLPIGSYPSEIYAGILYSLAEYLETACLSNEALPLLQAVIREVDKHGLPEIRHGSGRRFHWSTYCMSKLMVAKTKHKQGQFRQAKELALSITGVDDTQLPWEALANTLMEFGMHKEAVSLIDICEKPDYLCRLSDAFRDRDKLSEALLCTKKARRNIRILRQTKFLDDVEITEALIELESGKPDAGKKLAKFAPSGLAELDMVKRQVIGRRIVGWLYAFGLKEECKKVLAILAFERPKTFPADRFEFRQAVQPLFSSANVNQTLQAYQIMLDSKLSPAERAEFIVNFSNATHPDVSLFKGAYANDLANSGGLPEEVKLECLTLYPELAFRYNFMPIAAIDRYRKILSEIDELGPANRKLLEPSKCASLRAGTKLKVSRVLEKIGRKAEAIKLVEELESEVIPPEHLPDLFDLELKLNRLDKAKELVKKTEELSALVSLASRAYPRKLFELAQICLDKASTLQLNQSQQVGLRIGRAYLALEKNETNQALEILKHLSEMKGLSKDETTNLWLAQSYALLQQKQQKILARTFH